MVIYNFLCVIYLFSVLRVVGGTQEALDVMFAKPLSFSAPNVAKCHQVGVRL